MGVLRQHSAAACSASQTCAASADRRIDVDTGPQPTRPETDDAVADEVGQAIGKLRAAHGRSLPGIRWYSTGRRPQCPTAHASGLPPNVLPCSPGMQCAHDVPRRDDGRDRHDAAAEGLAEDVHVGAHVFVVAGEGATGATKARLDLVGHEQDAARGADVAHRPQVSVGRNDHAGFALDRFDQHRDGVVVDRGGQLIGVPEVDLAKAGRERAEVALRGRVAGEADDADRAAVEVVAGDHDVGVVGPDTLDFVAPLARQLDGALDRLGAAVHRQHGLHAAKLSELCGERARAGRGGTRDSST